MKIYPLDEHLVCRCGHLWKEHIPRAVTNPMYLTYPLTIKGMMAQQCSYNEGMDRYFRKSIDLRFCRCDNFSPRSFNVQKIVKEWRKKHGQPV